MGGLRSIAVIAVILGLASTDVRAERDWLMTVEANGAMPLSTPARDRFGIGGMPSATVFRAFNRLFLGGVRFRAGVLTDGSAPSGMNVDDPGAGSLASLTLVGRLRPLASKSDRRRGTGFWIDAGAGMGFTGDRRRLTAEFGVGYGFRVGSLTLGPSVRWLYLHQTSEPLDSNPAGIAMVGVELSLFDTPKPVVIASKPITTKPKKPIVKKPDKKDSDGDGIFDSKDKCKDKPEDKDGYEDDDGCPELDNDKDGIADADDECRDDAEVVNGIDDSDGCPDKGLIVLVKDRIVLEETVLFDSKRARVKRKARPVLRAIVNLANQHPEWQTVIIEGHTDVRGPDKYNMWLSELRAKRVRKALIKAGFPAEKLQSVGYGKSRPTKDGQGRRINRQNRRVEFVIIKTRQETRGVRIDKDGNPVGAPEDGKPVDTDSPPTSSKEPSGPDAAATGAADKKPSDGAADTAESPSADAEEDGAEGSKTEDKPGSSTQPGADTKADEKPAAKDGAAPERAR